jgi:hypothetical protein
MPFNVHTPERQPNETQQQYRERRAQSKAQARRVELVHNAERFGAYIKRKGMRA